MAAHHDVDDHSGVVKARYGIAWAWRGGRSRLGELTLGPGYLAIDDRIERKERAWLAAEQLAFVDHADTTERLRNLPTLRLEAGERTLLVAPLQGDQLSQLLARFRAFEALERPARPLHLVVAGGGVAALEAVLAIHEQAGEQVAVTLLSADRHWTHRPLTVLEPFGGSAPRIDVELLAHEVGARFELETLVTVDPERRHVTTTSGLQLGYDALLLALGARTRPALAGALTFEPRTAPILAALTKEVEQGHLNSVVFVVPRGVIWALPIYELALLIAERTAESRRPLITVVTSERAPLGLLGGEAVRAVEGLLAERRIRLLINRVALRVEPGSLVLAEDERLQADRVVSLPRLEGPFLSGLPQDSAGYLPTDRFGHVGALSSVLAAGDSTAFPIKQGGIAAQQAEVAAGVIAARAGAPVVPEPFDPVIEARLFTGRALLHLRSQMKTGVGETSFASSDAHWDLSSKISAPRLSAYLSRHVTQG
jgi:sulfide:quinone oxidoreductase